VRLTTYRTATGHAVGRVDGGGDPDDTVVTIEGFTDVGALLVTPDWRRRAEAAGGTRQRLGDLDLACVVPSPSKVICVGLNYRTHILEMGRELPEFPTLFAKFTATLTGPYDDLPAPPEDDALDWEAELTVVVGERARRVSGTAAEQAIAGFAVANDISMRTWQFRTKEWLQGKNWEATTPVGPWLVTPDELPGGVRPALAIRTEVDGEVVQDDNTGDLLFDPVALVEYVSTMITLQPGDLIASGTPGGVGHARKPARYLTAGQKVVREVEGLGRCENVVVDDRRA
jgi:acylpyruvate hydrolase